MSKVRVKYVGDEIKGAGLAHIIPDSYGYMLEDDESLVLPIEEMDNYVKVQFDGMHFPTIIRQDDLIPVKEGANAPSPQGGRQG